jgi:hypothetical protein
MLFKEIIAVHIENHTKPINKNADLLIVKAGGTYSYHQALKGNTEDGFVKPKRVITLEKDKELRAQL